MPHCEGWSARGPETLRVFSNWEVILVIMPRALMKDRRDRTCFLFVNKFAKVKKRCRVCKKGDKKGRMWERETGREGEESERMKKVLMEE
jgi:hypothetical protein